MWRIFVIWCVCLRVRCTYDAPPWGVYTNKQSIELTATHPLSRGLFGRYDEGAVPAWFREIALTEITEEQEGLPDGAVDVDGPLSQSFSVLCIETLSFAGIFATFVFLTLVASPRQQMDLATQSRSARLILHVAHAGSLVGV